MTGQGAYLALVRAPANQLQFNLKELQTDKTFMPNIAERVKADLIKSLSPPNPDYKGDVIRVNLTIKSINKTNTKKTQKLFASYELYLNRTFNIEVQGQIIRPDNSQQVAGNLTGESQTFKQEKDPPDYGLEQIYRNLLDKLVLPLKRQRRSF